MNSAESEANRDVATLWLGDLVWLAISIEMLHSLFYPGLWDWYLASYPLRLLADDAVTAQPRSGKKNWTQLHVLYVCERTVLETWFKHDSLSQESKS